jgi:phage baseplate assembly protein W
MASIVQQTTPSTAKRYFVGYSTQSSHISGVRSLYDVNLINVDLLNAFNTRVGERVMRPDYGCALWNYLMEPMTPIMSEQIIQEATRICGLDSRVVMQNVQVYQMKQGFSIAITLQYLPWLVISTFNVSFASNEAAYFGSNSNNQIATTGSLS